jgi:DUF4097 and DUF4098 domain-containing protein YvlB
MKKSQLALAMVLACACSGLAQSRFGFQQQDTVQRTLQFSSGFGRTLDVDNIDGSIRVTGYDGSNVEVTVNRAIRAQSPERLEAAKREVQLEITDRADVVRLYVNHPGRCNRDRNSGDSTCFSSSNETYRVNFDFDIRVPRDAAVRLRTVNGGDINVQNVAGDFDVDNINGSVEMLEMAGSGKAHALNGRMKVTFASNPRNASSFSSLNGNIEVAFQPGLSADLRFKTFNGSVFSDFPVEALSADFGAPGLVGQIFKKNQFQSGRVGRGGPELTFDGFNGTIKIIQAR